MAEFTAIIGNRGGGKTNFLTAVGLYYYRRGRKIIANFHLTFPHIYMPFWEIAEFGPDIRDAVILLDELGRGVDSYEWFSTQNKKMTNVILQIRKRHCEVWYTVQRFSLITIRLRDQTDGFILVDDLDGKLHHYVDEQSGETIEVASHRDICKGRFGLFMYDEDLRFVKQREFNGKPYWNMYNTDEEIADKEPDSEGEKIIKVPDWEL